MRWEYITIIKEVETGEDVLGNAITTDEMLGTYKGRVTEWTADEVEVLGRTFTDNHRKLITTAPKDTIKAAKKIQIDGDIHNIQGFKDLNRWRLVYLEGWRV